MRKYNKTRIKCHPLSDSEYTVCEFEQNDQCYYVCPNILKNTLNSSSICKERVWKKDMLMDMIFALNNTSIMLLNAN